MLVNKQRDLSRRGGTEALEFALIFPLFLVMVMGIMDYSWYFYQRAAVADAARRGCQAATQMNRAVDDYMGAAQAGVETTLMSELGVSCSGGVGCTIGLTDKTWASPPRLVCDVAIDYRSLTGFFGDPNGSGGGTEGAVQRLLGWDAGVAFIPHYVRGRASSIFEEVE